VTAWSVTGSHKAPAAKGEHVAAVIH
jgi:hypothetical protein